MDTQPTGAISLDTIPANRRLVEELFAKKLISATARRYALEVLYPARNWGLWVSRLLLTLGVSLILSGVIYFFAFNWSKIPVAVKFAVVEGSIAACIVAAWWKGLENFAGKLALLSASVLVGVFLAVFGQIYQTGADAYTLFMVWAILILPWTIIGEFAPLWVVWLAVSNVFIALFWEQAMWSAHNSLMFYNLMALLNLAALAAREYFVHRSMEWLEAGWTRFVLVVPTLVYLLFPTFAYIFERYDIKPSMQIGAALGVAVHAGLFYLYRKVLPDMWGLTATLLSACAIGEAACFQFLHNAFGRSDETALLLLMSLITLGAFTLIIILLRSIAAEMEARNA